MLDLGRDQAEDDDHDDQQNASGADAGRRDAFALRPLMLDQLDHTPQDQQRRPVVGEQVRQSRPTESIRIVPSRKTVPTTIRTNGPAKER